MKTVKENDRGFPAYELYFDVEYDVFYFIANLIEEKLQISFIEKLDDFDSLYWDFIFESTPLRLSYNIYMGVRVYPLSHKNYTPDDEATLDRFVQKLQLVVV